VSTQKIDWTDWARRTFWTAVAAVLSAIPSGTLLDVTAWQAAATAGITTVMTAVLVLARQQTGEIQ